MVSFGVLVLDWDFFITSQKFQEVCLNKISLHFRSEQIKFQFKIETQ